MREIKITINDDAIDDMQAITYVARVIMSGRISESNGRKQYCFASSFGDEDKETWVYASLGKGKHQIDKFRVTKNIVHNERY